MVGSSPLINPFNMSRAIRDELKISDSLLKIQVRRHSSSKAVCTRIVSRWTTIVFAHVRLAASPEFQLWKLPEFQAHSVSWDTVGEFSLYAMPVRRHPKPCPDGIDDERDTAKFLSASERLAEVADILAAGLMRSMPDSQLLYLGRRESSLDCPGHQSGHADGLTSHGGSK